MREAHAKVTCVNAIVDELEAERNSPEAIVKDLVSSFLMPEIEREALQRHVHVESKKFVLAAHNSIYQSGIGKPPAEEAA